MSILAENRTLRNPVATDDGAESKKQSDGKHAPHEQTAKEEKWNEVGRGKI